jgi:hypothetical protein
MPVKNRKCTALGRWGERKAFEGEEMIIPPCPLGIHTLLVHLSRYPARGVDDRSRVVELIQAHLCIHVVLGKCRASSPIGIMFLCRSQKFLHSSSELSNRSETSPKSFILAEPSLIVLLPALDENS